MSRLKNFKIYEFLLVICFIGIQSVKADYYKEYNVCDDYNGGIIYSVNDEDINVLLPAYDIEFKVPYYSERYYTQPYTSPSGETIYVTKCRGRQISIEEYNQNESNYYNNNCDRVLGNTSDSDPSFYPCMEMRNIIKAGRISSQQINDYKNFSGLFFIGGKKDFEVLEEKCPSKIDKALLSESGNEVVCFINNKEENLFENRDKTFDEEFQSNEGYVDCDKYADSLIDYKPVCKEYGIKTYNREYIIDPSEISLSEGTIELQKGETYDIKRILTVKYTKENTVTYTSSNPDKISVSSDGIITVNEVASAKITIASANNNGISAVLNVETSDIGTAPGEPNITEDINITNGDSITLPYDYDFTIISGESFVKKINKNTFQGIKVGTATVQYTTSSKQVITYNINIQKATTYAQGDLIILKKDKTYNFSSINSLGDLTWSSSDNNIAKVDNNGKVTGISSGIVTIMAKKEYYEYTNKVYVYESNVKKENIENAPSVDAEIGSKISIGLGSDYKWISSDPSIASVDNNGDITLLKEGTTIILGQKDDKYYAKEINVYTKKEDSTSDGTKGDGLSTDKVLDKNAEFRIENVLEDHKDYSKISNMFKKANKIKVYDIGYYLEDKKIQPNGEVIVELDIPQDFDANNIAVFRVEDNGTLTKLISKVVGNKIQVSTNHFSYYIIAEVNEPTAYEIVKEASNNGIIENPQTGTIISIIVVIIGAMIALGIYLSTKAKNKFIRL